ncbi:serine/threonine-protein kinase [Streptomyces sp. NBC_01551]|uniref:serine/threonine-protein kinase n=1 Tax=Streptomyces sp. NBC_01551 TaxID=2975876 RepID=UPI0022532B70|nr:serine/threonine-protein kinase [Streptomyces sp. NBC_01551]MCX4527862.1 serine/threonine-protein kinase [Streptomyces sp. NBC_01551]
MGDQLAGRYRLDQRLGQGGMGEVWRGHDLDLERAVAVKVLLEAATNDEVVARFRREATIGARLQHPGITVVHDVGRQDGRLFIVMELLSGEDLASVLARSPGGLPERTALDLAAQTAEALSAAHEQAVVHRDLKPGNLFLLSGGTSRAEGSGGGRLKICDFGIAHSSDATAGWTVTGRIFGTPPYMAPEQWRGEAVDARCDLYALGCVLYALLSGEPPFGSAEGPYVLMRRHIEDEPEPLAVGPELNALVRALLAKSPADRPESAQAVGKTLRGLLGGPGGVSPDGSGASAAGPETRESVREFVRGLLLEAVDELEELERDSGDVWHGHPSVEVLARAADAAARFDAGLAERLLASAELSAWRADSGSGVTVARRLTALARHTGPHAPARTERLLTAAEQALFTVFPPGRHGPLASVAEELARVAPERAAVLARRHFGDVPPDGVSDERIWLRVAEGAARTDPARLDAYLELIPVPWQRASAKEAAELAAAVAVAAHDPEPALRLIERMPGGDRRVEALCEVAAALRVAGHPGELFVERAEQEFALLARQHSARGGPVRGPADPEVADARAALERARARLRPLDPAAARERAAAARAGHEPRSRVRELTRIALECVGDQPWLSEVAAGPGTPPARERAFLPGATPGRVRPGVAPGEIRWRAAVGPGMLPGLLPGRGQVSPAALHAAGECVVWSERDAVGSVWAATGAGRWSAYADEGVPARPLPNSLRADGPRARVRCAADADSAVVAVEAPDGPGVRLLAREPEDGRVRWWRDLPETRMGQGPALTLAGGLVLCGARGELVALDRATGATVWRRPVQGGGSRGPVVSGDCLVLADGLLLTALRAADGQPLWSWPRNNHVPGPRLPGGPVHVMDGNTVRALRRHDGRELWRFEAGSPAPRPLVEGGVVYAAVFRPEEGWDVVYALHAESGAVLWQQRVVRRGGPACALEPLGIRRGVLYVKSSDAGRGGLLGRTRRAPFLTGLELSTGKPVWQWDRPGPYTVGALLSADGIVLTTPELTAIALP